MRQRRPLLTPSKITQISREFGVTARALRFYEEQGLLSPTRHGEVRLYSNRDRVRLRLVLGGKRIGFSLRAIRDLFDIYDREGETAQFAEALPRLKAQLPVLEAERDRIDAAIAALKAALARLAEDWAAAPPHSDHNMHQRRSRHG